MGEGEAKSGFDKADLLRFARDWHGYFSAIAFLSLIFFAATGIVLNHPKITDNNLPPLIQRPFKLTPDEVAGLSANAEAPKALVQAALKRGKLRGTFTDGQKDGDDIFVRMQGARGNSDLHADLKTGKVEVTIVPARLLDVLNNLHRGERAGLVWQVMMDGLAVIMIAMSVLGYVLFLMLRFRVRTAFILTGASLAVMLGIFLAFTPP